MPHTASPLPRPGHIGLNVSDIDRSVSFYKDLLGFQVLLEGGAGDRKFAFLGDGGKPVLTLWQQSTGSFEKRRPGLHHFAFEVGAVDEVRRLEAKLHARGIHFHYEGIVPHVEGAASGGIYFEDPDGIRLEVYAPEGVHGAAPVAGAPSCGFF